MLSKTFLALCALLLTSPAHALICDKARYPWYGQQPTFDIVEQSPPPAYTKTLQGTPRISGKLQILDGCTFRLVGVSGEKLVQAAAFKWMAVKTPSDVIAQLVSEQTFYIPAPGDGQNLTTNLYSLTTVAGREISFYDFSIIRLFSDAEQNWYASITLTNGDMTPPGIGEAPKAPAPQLPTTVQAPLLSAPTAGSPIGTPVASPLPNSFRPGVGAPTTAGTVTQPTGGTSIVQPGASPAGSVAPGASPKGNGVRRKGAAMGVVAGALGLGLIL